MPNPHISSFWQTGGSASAQATMLHGGIQCRCGRRCICPPGQPCRCGGRCTCARAPQAGQTAAMGFPGAQGFEGEFGSGRRSGRDPYRGPSAIGANAPFGWKQHWLRSRADSLYGRRLSLQRNWQRRQQLNRYFARRFGWGRQMSQLARMIGCPTCQPGSQRFMFALARWQRLNGMRATGVLTPWIWWSLRSRGASASGGAPDIDADWPPQAGAPWPADEPTQASAADDNAMPLPLDEPGPDASPADKTPPGEGSELGARFRRRRLMY